MVFKIGLQEKMKIYLDTSIIYGYFYAKVFELRGRKRYKEPKVIKFLKINKEKFSYFTSSIVKSEVFRRLITELEVKSKEVESLWLGLKEYLNFLEIFADISVEEIWKDVLEIVSKVKIKKRFTNLEHWVLAKKFNLWFLTGDKEVLKKCRFYYEKIISCVELRKYLNKDNGNSNCEERKDRDYNFKWKKGNSFEASKNCIGRGVRKNSDAHLQKNSKKVGEKRKTGWITLPIIASISLVFVCVNLSFGKIIINGRDS